MLKKIGAGRFMEGLLKVWFISPGIMVFLTGKHSLPVLSSIRGGAKHA